MDYSLQYSQSYIGKPVSQLPTPSLVLNLPILKGNIDRLHQDVEQLGIRFRPHVKTLKTIEATRLLLAGGKYRSIVASTLSEIRGVLSLVREDILDECLYGLPICPGYLPALSELNKSLRITLMVDNQQQISMLERHGSPQPWGVYIKIDVGSQRAGVTTNSVALPILVEQAEKSSAVEVLGFYCHAGHSYAGRTPADAEETLNLELSSILDAAKLLPTDRELIVSIGATPTAHVIKTLKASIPTNVKLELHAGNFLCNDLQQVSTGVVEIEDQALQIAAEVCSVYPERNEALVNAGVIALSRETSGYAGFGRVVGRTAWAVVRLSQEHGILGVQDTDKNAPVTHEFEVGQRVYLFCNHACITAASFHAFYIVDKHGTVIDTWVPWKGW